VSSALARRTTGPRLLLRKPEAAEALAVSERFLDELVRRGDVAVIHLPGRGKQARAVRYCVRDLERYVSSLKDQEQLKNV
jgi:hypothetical protein